MEASAINFDWWLLVVVPAIVSIFAYYIQKLIDRAGLNSIAWLNRYMLQKSVFDTTLKLKSIADGTFPIRYARQQNMLVASGVLIFVNVIFNIVILDGSSLSFIPIGAKTIHILLAVINSAVSVMFLVTYIRLINDNNIYCAPIYHVAEIEQRIAKLFPGKFHSQLDEIKCIAFRLEAVRKDRINQALKSLNIEDLEEYNKILQNFGNNSSSRLKSVYGRF